MQPINPDHSNAKVRDIIVGSPGLPSASEAHDQSHRYGPVSENDDEEHDGESCSQSCAESLQGSYYSYQDCASSSSSSSEDGYLSVFEQPIQTRPILESSHPFFQQNQQLMKRVLAEFRYFWPQSLSSTTEGTNKRTRSDVQSSRSSKKLKPSGPDGKPYGQGLEHEAKLGCHMQDSGAIIVSLQKWSPMPPIKYLACPFAARFPAKHHSCFVHCQFQDMSSLHKHIWASHRRPYYCPICYGTFETVSLRDDHVSVRACDRQPSVIFEGATEQQMRLVERGKVKQIASEEEKWRHTYDVLFPGVSPPTTAYVPEGIQRVICMVHDYWDKRGHQTVSDVLGVNEAEFRGIYKNSNDNAPLRMAVLEAMVDRLLGSKWWAHKGCPSPSSGSNERTVNIQ